jgi:hypothetical protein
MKQSKAFRHYALIEKFYFRLEARLGGWEFTSDKTKATNWARAERLACRAEHMGIE